MSLPGRGRAGGRTGCSSVIKKKQAVPVGRPHPIQIVCLTEAKVRMPLPLVDTLHSPSNG